MAEATSVAFCGTHTDNCERLARLESGLEGVRRDVATTQVQQSTIRDELLARFDRFESTNIQAYKDMNAAVVAAYRTAQQTLVKENAKLLGGIVGGGGLLGVLIWLIKSGTI